MLLRFLSRRETVLSVPSRGPSCELPTERARLNPPPLVKPALARSIFKNSHPHVYIHICTSYMRWGCTPGHFSDCRTAGPSPSGADRLDLSPARFAS